MNQGKSGAQALRTFAALALSLSATILSAQEPAPEPGLAISANDPVLVWGPCPAFMPAGCEIAVLHGDPAQDNVDVLFKVPPKTSIPWHRHSSARRMVLVRGELRLTYDNQKTVMLDTGDYAYAPAGRRHDGYCASRTSCVLFIAFESPLDPKLASPVTPP